MIATYPSIGTPAQLGARLTPARTLADADETRAQAILDDISALARKESGSSSRWVDTTPTPDVSNAPDDVLAIVLRAARREFLNPDGFASEQDGDYSYRIDSDSLPAEGGVFTAAELETLRSYRDTSELWSLKITGSEEQTRMTGNILEDIRNATFPS